MFHRCFQMTFHPPAKLWLHTSYVSMNTAIGIEKYGDLAGDLVGGIADQLVGTYYALINTFACSPSLAVVHSQDVRPGRTVKSAAFSGSTHVDQTNCKAG